jgi:hypothetical protein
MNSKRTLLAAGAALAIVGAMGWLVMHGPHHDFAPEARDAAKRGSGDAAALPLAPAAGAESERLAATRDAEAAQAGEANAAASPLPAAGKVHLKVADVRTQAELEHVRVRYATETRFAGSSGDREITTTLTSGAWEASVSVTGFEPARLGPFEVKAGETLELGTIALGRGVGVIEGQVTALHAGRDHPVVVQLYGDGRSPCDRCLGLLERPPEESKADRGGAPVAPFGSDCAFSDARDELTLQGGGAFRFEHLAAGIYWLRASDPAQRIVEARRIELGRGGRVWQNLDVSAPTQARFELRHDGGGLFTGAWSAIHAANPAAIHYEFRRRGRTVAGVDVAPTADDCLASVGPPIAIPGRERQPQVTMQEGRYLMRFSSSVQVQGAPSLGRLFYNDGKGWVVQPADPDDRDDRTRKEGDALLVDGGEPDCDASQLQAKALRPDLHEIAPLPRAELSVIVSCGDYKSDETPINLCSDPFEPFVVALKLREEIQTRLPEIRKGPPASCNACHGSDAPTDGRVNYGDPQVELTFDFGDAFGGQIDGSAIETAIGEALKAGALPPQVPSSDGDH